MLSRSTALRSGVAALALAATVAATGTAHAATTLVETGSSLLYPLFNLWVPAFTAAHPDVQITTTSTGSGAGIAQSIKNLVQIGASDAYMSNALVHHNPNMLNIPLAISAQAVNYNLPGLGNTHIKLSGPILAGIYSGKITMWNDRRDPRRQPGRRSAGAQDHPHPPRRRFGRHLHLHPVSGQLHPLLGQRRALRHDRVLAGG